MKVEDFVVTHNDLPPETSAPHYGEIEDFFDEHMQFLTDLNLTDALLIFDTKENYQLIT